VHLREFARAANIPFDPVADPSIWDDETKTATFKGTDRYGNDLELLITADSPTMVVNGQTVDIATYSGASEYAGQYKAQLFDSNGWTLYLPFKAVAKAYGAEVEYVDGTDDKIIIFSK